MKLNNMHLIIFLIVILLFSLFFGQNVTEGFTTGAESESALIAQTKAAAIKAGLNDTTPTLSNTTPSSGTDNTGTYITDSAGVKEYISGPSNGSSNGSSSGTTGYPSDTTGYPSDTTGYPSGTTDGSGSTLGSNFSYIKNLFDPTSSAPTSTSSSAPPYGPPPGSGILPYGSQTLAPISSTESSTLYSNNYSSAYSNDYASPSSIIIGPGGQQILATSQNTISGIPPSQIPAGQEDLYILKSEIVPPVCPACPNVIIDKSIIQKECQPCPPCARCPEPSFNCKKVPNYSLGVANTYLPRPILNDFSQFGS